MTHGPRVTTRLIVLSLFFFLLPVAWGQYGSSLEGVITDQTGVAVSSAKVTATNEATGVVREAQTDSTGFYRISGLAPGTYPVSAEAGSFKPQVTPNVVVAAEAVRGLNLSLRWAKILLCRTVVS